MALRSDLAMLPAWLAIGIAVLTTVHVLVAGCDRTSVVLRNNGYQKLLVALDVEVEPNAVLVERVKGVITNASRLLYQMSRKRAFFEDVHILLPDSWPDSAEYQLSTWQQVDKSDVTVGPVPRQEGQGAGQGAGDAPFTVRTTPCGELGSLLHLTPAYLLNDSLAAQYGPYDKVFLHEWSHLRYGVFDEYSDVDTDFYAASNGELEGTRCPAQMKGEMFDEVSQSTSCGFVNGQPDANCRFRPDMSSLPARSASLMFHTRSGQISEWCDDDVSKPETLHNRQAPSQHNRQCGGRSVWEVLRDHVDFRKRPRKPWRRVVPPDPVFTLVKRRSRRTVLVLDVSDAMKTNDRIARMAQATSNYLLHVARDGEEVGIVWFQSLASIRVLLTAIGTDTRRHLLREVPERAEGRTSIGDGLLKGMAVLQRFRGQGSEEGGTIILLSGGLEHEQPLVNETMARLVATSVHVHSIAVGGEADPSLELVAKATGGQSFSFLDTHPSNTLNDAFLALADAGLPTKQQQAVLVSRKVGIYAGLYDVTAFVIDSTAKNDVSVAINYMGTTGHQPDKEDSIKTVGPEVTMTSPSGRLMTSSSPEYKLEPSFNTVYFSLGQTTEIGKYQIHVTNTIRTSTPQTVFVTVTARMTQGEEAPVLVRAEWRHQTIHFPTHQQALYVSVSKGYVPLLNAEVKATMENPPATSTGSAKSSKLLLRDNGAGSDVKADDGVYSSYVTTFTADGRYNVRVNVRDAAGTVVSDGLVGVGSPPRLSRSRSPGKPVEPFQRVVNPGNFVVKGFNPNAGDVLAPARIGNLEVRSIEVGAVHLAFTAVGDDLDQGGPASGYVLKMSRDFKVLSKDPNKVANVTRLLTGHLTAPKSPHSTEIFNVYVGRDNGTYYFAIQAYDDSNNISPLSNIVSASTNFVNQNARQLNSDPPRPSDPPASDPLRSDPLASDPPRSEPFRSDPSEADDPLVVVVLCVIGVFAFVAATVGSFICMRQRQSGSDANPPEGQSSSRQGGSRGETRAGGEELVKKKGMPDAVRRPCPKIAECNALEGGGELSSGSRQYPHSGQLAITYDASAV